MTNLLNLCINPDLQEELTTLKSVGMTDASAYDKLVVLDDFDEFVKYANVQGFDKINVYTAFPGSVECQLEPNSFGEVLFMFSPSNIHATLIGRHKETGWEIICEDIF